MLYNYSARIQSYEKVPLTTKCFDLSEEVSLLV